MDDARADLVGFWILELELPCKHSTVLLTAHILFGRNNQTKFKETKQTQSVIIHSLKSYEKEVEANLFRL
jgi:hypothetical protein